MKRNLSYQSVMARKNEIMKASLGMNFDAFIHSPISFDYERMMQEASYPIEELFAIQRETKVSGTPIFELKRLTEAVRRTCSPGFGARIFIKDEAANASGSFKARRASVSVYEAKKRGYKGVCAATSGNYGAAVASQAAQRGLKAIIIQEVYDSAGVGQPEIIEKGRKCEAFGAEVQKMTVGPELFYHLLVTLEETGFFNASLYTPFGIAGIETLGVEIAEQMQSICGHEPDVIIATHAGGGNLTGTARGLRRAGAHNTKCIACSVDLSGLHMASDHDFNRKSFTTGHTGFGIPFASWPDRVDVPRNAARALRYMDDYLLVSQGEVFFVTELLSKLEGIERGPAGNTSLTAAVALSRQLSEDKTIVVQETEYTGAGKHHNAQLSFARSMGIEVKRGDPKDDKPGVRIVIPDRLSQVRGRAYSLDALRESYLKSAENALPMKDWDDYDRDFLAADMNVGRAWLEGKIK